MQAQLSSVMDWLGRAMIDFTPHMMSEVQEMNEDLKEFGVPDLSDVSESEEGANESDVHSE